MIYSAAFDVSQLTLGTLTIGTSGHSDAVVTLGTMTTTSFESGTTSIMIHGYDASSTCTTEDGSGSTGCPKIAKINYARALRTSMQAAAVSAGWGGDAVALEVDWSSTTGLFSYTYDTTFSLTWSLAAGQAVCGVSGNQSGASFYQGTVIPTYCIKPTLSTTSDSVPNYEPSNIANHIRSNSGGGYGQSRYVSPVCRDWVQQYETKAKTIAASAASTHPWTFEAMLKHCRGQYPFMVIDGFGESFQEMFSLRTEGTPWHPEYATPNDGTAYHIPFRTWVEGKIT